MREGEPVRIADVRREPQFRGNEATGDVRSELVVPIRSGGSLWGALNLEHTAIDFFGAGDLRMVEAIAAQLGGALRALDLYESLERAYVGTAEALSAALEAKDPHTASTRTRSPSGGRGRPPPRHGRRGASGPAPRRRLSRHRQDRIPRASSTSPAR